MIRDILYNFLSLNNISLKYYHFTAIIFLLFSCSGPGKIRKQIAVKTNNDSTSIIHSLTESSDKEYVIYITPDGRKLLLKNDSLQMVRPASISYDSISVNMDIIETAGAGELGNHGGVDDPFTGVVRPTVKTSYSSKSYESFGSIAALYRSLKSKEFMDNLSIGHSDDRVSFENRNVKITTAYLYTITVESDNDFHLLIGNTPVYNPGTTRVFNAEIPGVPRDGDMATKQHVRELRAKLLRIFSAIPVCGNRGYLQEYTKITIRGSLFYDTQHKSNPAKCKDVEGESAWEIHPVWDIQGLN